MPHDLFISYAHQGDNTSREAVAALVARLHAELEADFRRRFNRDLEIFFDKEDIQDFDHWQVRCHRALRDSRFCQQESESRSNPFGVSQKIGPEEVGGIKQIGKRTPRLAGRKPLKRI
jgi:hypothetical protein